MKDVSSILTKKQYGHKALKNNDRARQKLARAGEISFEHPKWLAAIFIMIIAVAGMGEDKVLNLRFGGLPKALTLLVLVIAFFTLIVKGDLRRFRYIGKTSILYIIYWALLCLWSVILWVINFSANKAITRGVEKMGFQTIAIFVAIAAVYVFGEKAIDHFAAGIYIANGLIAVMEMPNYGGPFASIESIINLVTSFGDGHGFALAMEIHEVTFLYGMFLMYYLVFSPRETPADKRRNRIHIALSVLFLVVGFKRLFLLCVPLFALFARWIKRSRWAFRITMVIGVFWTVFFVIYLYIAANGALSSIAKQFGVDMMGRDHIWRLVKSYFRLSPLFMGNGFGVVDSVIVSDLYHAGLIDKAYPLHNDILKVFIEFGFPGLMFWSGAQYILFPALMKKFFDTDTAVLYMALMSLMATTYMTDNTAFYFWCMIALRMIPLGYGIYRRNKTGSQIKEERAKWSPPSQTDFKHLVDEKMIRKEPIP